MKFIEIDGKLIEKIDEIAKLEKECFENGSIDHWVIRPIARYGKIYCVEKNKKIVAFAEIIRCWDIDEVFLFSFGVTLKERGVGTGSYLMRNIIEKLKIENIKRIKLTVSDGNIAAKQLYMKFGFVQKAQLKDEYGTGNSRILMEYVF